MPFLHIPANECGYFYLCEGIRAFDTLAAAQTYAQKVSMEPSSEAYFPNLNPHHWQVVELCADGSEIHHGRIVYHPTLT